MNANRINSEWRVCFPRFDWYILVKHIEMQAQFNCGVPASRRDSDSRKILPLVRDKMSQLWSVETFSSV